MNPPPEKSALPSTVTSPAAPQPETAADPNRTVIPGLIVDAVVVEPYGAHPSYAQGHYDRDDAFYVAWDAISRDRADFTAWMEQNVL